MRKLDFLGACPALNVILFIVRRLSVRQKNVKSTSTYRISDKKITNALVQLIITIIIILVII